jgi:WD40 repeat protein
LGIAFSPDGRFLATAGNDTWFDSHSSTGGSNLGAIRLWDASDGQPVLALRGWVGPGSPVFSPDGRRLAWPSADEAVRIWDIAAAAPYQPLRFDRFSGDPAPPPLAVSGDGRLLARPNGSVVELRELPSGRVVDMIRAEEGSVAGTAISPDGRRVATLTGTIDIHDRTTGHRIRLGRGTTGVGRHFYPGMAFAPDGRWLAVALGSQARVFDTTSGRQVFATPALLDPKCVNPECVAFSPDGRYFAVGWYRTHGLSGGAFDSGSAISVWEVGTWASLPAFGGSPFVPTGLAFAPDGTRLAVARGDSHAIGYSTPRGNPHRVELWDVAAGTLLQSWEGHTGHVERVTFTGDGRGVLSAGRDGTLRLWDAETGEEILTLRGHSGPIGELAASADGRRVVTATHVGGTDEYFLWDALPRPDEQPPNARVPLLEWFPGWDAGRVMPLPAEPLATVQARPGAETKGALSPDGARVALVTGATVKLYDGSDGRELHTLTGLPQAIAGVQFSPDGTRVFAWGGPRRVGRLGWKDNKWVTEWSGQDKPGEVRVWEVATGREVTVFRGHQKPVSGVVFSPDGATAVSWSGGEKMARVWDVATGQERLARPDTGTSLFTPDGQLILSAQPRPAGASQLPEAVVWELATGRAVRTLPAAVFGTSGSYFSPDGRWLVAHNIRPQRSTPPVWYVDAVLVIWDVAAGREVRRFGLQPVPYLAVRFRPDGRLLTADRNRVVAWDVTTGEPVEVRDAGGLANASFSLDGRRLLSGGRVWDVARFPLYPASAPGGGRR